MSFEVPPYFREKLFSLEKKHWFFASLSFLSGIALIIYFFVSGPTPTSYFLGENAFVQWKNSPQDDQLFSQMQKEFKEVPLLQKKYEAPIAQLFLEQKAFEKAYLFAKEPLKRLHEEAPLYASFAETSFLIEEGKYDLALEKTLSLKEELQKECDDSIDPLASSGRVLYLENLLRIAFLQKKMDRRQEEKAAWLEFEAEVQKNEDLKKLVYQSFQEKLTDLSSFIETRKKS